MNLSRIWNLTKKSVNAWIDDYAPSMGAALAYYTLFSIAPVLIIVIAIAGFVFGQEAAQGAISAQLVGLLGEDGATAVEGLLESASNPTQGLIATIGSVILLVLGATTVFAELQSDLDRIWRAPALKQQSGVWGLIRTRLLSFGMVLAIGFLLLMSLALSAALAALGNWWGGLFPGWEALLQGLNFVVSFAVITGLFAAIYKILPRVDVPWRDVWIGSAVTALLFTIGKLLIGLYIGKSGIASGFGAAGSFVVLLVWVYYSTQIFLLGAEFTSVYSNEHGSRAGASASLPDANVAADEASNVVPNRQVHVPSEDATPLPVSSASDERLLGSPRTIPAARPGTTGVSDRARAYLRKNPFQSAGIATATGFLVAAALRRRKEDDRQKEKSTE